MTYVPAFWRQYIVGASGLARYDPSRQSPDYLGRLAAVMEYFGDSAESLAMVRAHRAAGRETDALQMTLRILDQPQANLDPKHHLLLVGDCCWMLRRAGRPAEALSRADGWLKANKKAGDSRVVIGAVIHAEKVRALAALGDWEEAERTANEAIAARLAERPVDLASLYGLLGFMRDRRGDSAGAASAWSDGYQTNWIDAGIGLFALDGIVLGSLCDKLSTQDIRNLISLVVADSQRPLLAVLEGQGGLSPENLAPVVRAAFHSPRGREYARKIVFREVPFAECIRVPPLLVAMELIQQGAFSSGYNNDQEELVWQLAGDCYTSYGSGQFSKPQMLQLLLTWKGVTNFLGWGGLAPQLAPQLRGPLAYVMAHRYIQLQRHDDAKMFLGTAQADAARGSVLAELVTMDLSQPKRHKPAGSIGDISPERR